MTEPTTPTSDESPALAADINDVKDAKPTFDFADETWTVERKPNQLLLAELARAEGTQRAEDLGVIADFLETALGREQYARFRRIFFTEIEDDDELGRIIKEIVELTYGRPTK